MSDVKKISADEIGADLRPILPAIWRFALSLCARPDVADDLAQATCLRAMERAGQFKPGSNLCAWCLTICRSIWLNEVRAATIRTHKSLDSDTDFEVISPAPSAESNILTAEVFTKVMHLPEAQREAVLLVYVEGFTYAEASAVLNIPIGTVMSRLFAARSKLRQVLEVAPETKERSNA